MQASADTWGKRASLGLLMENEQYFISLPFPSSNKINVRQCYVTSQHRQEKATEMKTNRPSTVFACFSALPYPSTYDTLIMLTES